MLSWHVLTGDFQRLKIIVHKLANLRYKFFVFTDELYVFINQLFASSANLPAWIIYQNLLGYLNIYINIQWKYDVGNNHYGIDYTWKNTPEIVTNVTSRRKLDMRGQLMETALLFTDGFFGGGYLKIVSWAYSTFKKYKSDTLK